jgi:hypothetical protein
MKTPGEILSHNPWLKDIWTASDIGYLLRLGLVKGKKIHRGCIVSEKDVLELSKITLSNEK